MTEENKQPKTIEQYLDEARAAISAAEALSDTTGEGFSWDLAYGMGGYYEPQPYTKDEALAVLASGKTLSEKEKKWIAECIEADEDVQEENSWGEPNYGWHSSSQSC